MLTAGEHKIVINKGLDINKLTMVYCSNCKSITRGIAEEKALEKMAIDRCVPNCKNCENLRNSYRGAPAVPTGGSCNDSDHACPNCGKKWWQYNRHYHFWGQV